MLQGSKLLSLSEVLCGEFRLVTQDHADYQQKNGNQAHFTASKNLDQGSETIAEAREESNRKSFVDKVYRLNAMDTFWGRFEWHRRGVGRTMHDTV